MTANTDAEAWSLYPHHRQFFNKLWLAEYLGHKCGPAGYAPTEMEIPDNVIVRPIYNLSGMGVGARPLNLIVECSSRYTNRPNLDGGSTWDPPTKTEVLEGLPAGTFWCEKFEGDQLSTTLRWVVGRSGFGSWEYVSTYQAEMVRWKQRAGTTQQFVDSWARVPPQPIINLNRLDVLADVGTINVETVGGNIIEVHLRGSPDPAAEVFIPVFKGDEESIVRWTAKGYTFVYAYDDADGQLPIPRLGFMVRN